MLIIPEVLTHLQVRQFRTALDQGNWQDGRQTAGHLAKSVKANQQLAHDDPLTHQLGDFIIERLGANPCFNCAALPLKVLPPRFNRYREAGSYGKHTDNAVFSVPGTSTRVRSDLSATLFLSDPADYDGGELVVDDAIGHRSIKLPAGHLLLYPGDRVHRVMPVTRGTRLAAFFWVQSLVPGGHQRQLLQQLDGAIQNLALQLPNSSDVVKLKGVYQNLLRQWAHT